MIQFKKVELEDWGLLQTLEEAAATSMFATCDGEEGYKKYIRESTVYFIVDELGKHVGSIAYKTQADGAVVINGLTVNPEKQGQGVAKQAMEKLLNEIGNKDIVLTVHPGNTPALLIYLRLGFVITDWKENYFGDGEPRLYLQRKKS